MTRRRRSIRLPAHRPMCGFIGKAVGQKRLAFALEIGGGVCWVMLFNSVLVEILNDNALLGVWVSAEEAPVKRHLMKYDLSSTYSNRAPLGSIQDFIPA